MKLRLLETFADLVRAVDNLKIRYCRAAPDHVLFIVVITPRITVEQVR